MKVCRKCHELDSNAIQCTSKLGEHSILGVFKCEICGNVGVLYICHKYDVKHLAYIKKLRGN